MMIRKLSFWRTLTFIRQSLCFLNLNTTNIFMFLDEFHINFLEFLGVKGWLVILLRNDFSYFLYRILLTIASILFIFKTRCRLTNSLMGFCFNASFQNVCDNEMTEDSNSISQNSLSNNTFLQQFPELTPLKCTFKRKRG